MKEAVMSYKILYLMEYPIDLPGGAQMSTQTLCEELLDTEFESVVVCPTLLHTRKEELPFRVVEFASDENREDSKGKRIRNFVKRIGSFKRAIKAERPDIIHIQMSESLITFGFLRCLGRFARIPFVYTDRSLYYGYRLHSMTCIKAVLRYAARMICTTQFNQRLWLEHSKFDRIDVISNTISTAFTPYDADRRKRLREEAGLEESDFVIGFAGRISEEKDWPFVKELVESFCEKDIDFKIALVISVYEEQDLAIVADLKNSISAMIGEENLIYMQDLSQAEIADYYYLVDVFVMSSMFESFGKAAVEAMSRRCAVVSTSVGGLTEVVAKKDNLYTKEKYIKCADRIDKLYHDKAELEFDKDYFYQRYQDNYTREICLQKHVRLYKEILL